MAAAAQNGNRYLVGYAGVDLGTGDDGYGEMG